MMASTSADTVPQLLAQRVAQSPNAPAFRVEDAVGVWQSTTWREFSERIATLRSALVAAGLRKGDRLALIAPVSLEWEILHHAALGMGLVVVGLDAHDLPGRIAGMAEQAGISAFAVSDVRILSGLEPGRLAACRLLLRLGDAIDTPAGWPPGARWLNWDEFAACGAQVRASITSPAAADTATIIFTSGTTGSPKGIAYSHAQLCLAIDAIRGVFGFVSPDSQLLCWLPLSNLLQRMVNLAAMGQGACTYLLDDPRRVMMVVADVSPDIFVGVPRFYEKLYDGVRANIASQSALRRRLVKLAWGLGRRASRLRLAGRKLPLWLAFAHGLADLLVLRRVRRAMGRRLRCMVTGSAPTPRHLLEEFHALGWLVLEAYGLSENVIPMAMNRPDDFRFGTVGRPMPGNEISIGVDGLVKVRGAGVFSGYLGGLGGELDAEGFYLTGDLGEFDPQGFLRLTGRTGDIIKTSTGRRVAPAGIEAKLREVPGIDQAVVLGAGCKYLIALCSCSTPHPSSAERREIERALLATVSTIGEPERPRGIVLLEQPFAIESGELTTNLKVRRTFVEVKYSSRIRELRAIIDGESHTVAGAATVL